MKKVKDGNKMKKEKAFKYLVILKDGECQGVTYCDSQEDAYNMLLLDYDRVEVYEYNGKYYDFIGYSTNE